MHIANYLCGATLLAATLTGCAATSAPDEPIVYSDDWFRCQSRFQCVVVMDAYCQLRGVNARHALIYQDWTLQQVELAGERMVCGSPDLPSTVAVCSAGRCVVPGRVRKPEDEEQPQ